MPILDPAARIAREPGSIGRPRQQECDWVIVCHAGSSESAAYSLEARSVSEGAVGSPTRKRGRAGSPSSIGNVACSVPLAYASGYQIELPLAPSPCLRL